MFNTSLCCGDCKEYIGHFFNSLDAALMLKEMDSGIGDLKIMDANIAFMDTFGWNKEELIGKMISDIYPDAKTEWISDCRRCGAEGRKRTKREIYSSFSDKYFRIDLNSPVKGQYLALFHDITEIIRAEEVLQKHYILFNNAKDIILYLNSDGRIIDANKKAVEKYGYTYDELLQMKLQQLRHPCSMKDYEQQMSDSALKGTVFECIHIKKSGEEFPVEVSSRTTEVKGEQIRIHIIRDITERKEAEKKINHMAKYDELTQIFNRASLMEQLTELLGRSKNAQTGLAVMLFDVDKFKAINDVHGHNAGDAVLRAVGQRLQAAVRQGDVVGRLGGDEFLVIQQLGEKKELDSLPGRILDQVAKPVLWNGKELNVRISIGVAYCPDDAVTVEELIYCADHAMYEIKNKGGSGYGFYRV